MGASKTEIYSREAVKIAKMAKVLAHPARVMILQFISKQQSCICNDIVEEIGLSQPTISQHLQIINDAGLLKGNFKGAAKCYCLDIESFDLFKRFLDGYFEMTKSNCC